MRKVLWAVDVDPDKLLQAARHAGTKTICARTTNTWLPSAISGIKSQGFEVYAWRWPSVRAPDGDRSHRYAGNEAAFVKTLIDLGLDGYIVDPECDKAGRPDCWNDASLAPLAKDFCTTIKDAGRARNPSFVFGTTSGGEYPTYFKDIPWAEFVAHSDVLLPQCYWIGDSGAEHGGTPSAAYAKCVKSWKRVASASSRIIPIFGDLGHAHANEIQSCQRIISSNRLDEAHFYTYSSNVTADKLDAISSIGTASTALQVALPSAVSEKSKVEDALRITRDTKLFNEVQDEAARRLYSFDGEIYPADGCAITLSVLLQTAGIDVPDIFRAFDLGNELLQRGWSRVPLGQQQSGDIGSTCGESPLHGRDHIYVVVKSLNDDEMVIADNQSPRPHFRFVSGLGRKTPTKFFLRANTAERA